MTVEDTTTTVDDADSDADFGSGFSGKAAEKTPAKEAPAPAETPREEADPEPKYRQVTEKDWEEVVAAAKKTASYDQQLSKAFGTIGNLQKLVNGLQDRDKPATAAPAPRKIDPKAFEAMRKDFPELADLTQSAIESALSGLHGTSAEFDAGKLKEILAQRETEALKDEFPDWMKIVGAPAAQGEPVDHNTDFRKWLLTRSAEYQARVTNTESPPVLARAIRLFQNEVKATPKVVVPPRNDARADRIKAAIQPKGDNAGGAPSKTDDDEFAAGFNSR